MGKTSALTVECSEEIGAPAEAVWSALTPMRGAAMPVGVVESFHTDRSVMPFVQTVRLSDRSVMRQHVVSRSDEEMTVHLEMLDGENVPWSEYRSMFRIEPISATRCRAVVSVTAEPLSDPEIVRAMLRDVFILSLRTLKSSVEASSGGRET